MLGERFEAPVEVFDPFKRVAFDAKKFNVDAAEDRADGGGGGRARAAPGGRPMIRINLLAVERERTKKPRVAHSRRAARHDRRHADSDRHGARRRLVVLVAAPARRSRIDAGDRPGRDRDAAAARRARAGAEVRERARRSCSSASRSSSSCGAARAAPVHVLDEISRSLPERLWLTEMTQTAHEFVIAGMATSLTALSDFVANLEVDELVQEAGRNRRQPGAVRREDRRPRAVLDQGDVQRSRTRRRRRHPAAKPPGETAAARAVRGNRQASMELSLSKLPW